jgi:hypothetical protein
MTPLRSSLNRQARELTFSLGSFLSLIIRMQKLFPHLVNKPALLDFFENARRNQNCFLPVHGYSYRVSRVGCMAARTCDDKLVPR